MTIMARIEDDAVAEERNLDLQSVPAHKAAIWRPIEGEPPTADRYYYDVTGPVHQIEPDRVLRVWTVTARDLVSVKAEAKRRTGNAAEQARSKYITTGSGKAMSYQQVASEAVRYVATNGAGAYPFLQARVDSGRYPDLATAASGTLAIEQQWATIGASIDMIEDKAKLEIDAATTVEQVQAAAAVVAWP